ncbi:hypothetical protein Vafri_19593 [Volvox africanus]|uniref:Uncharacterized protein n=1 Tax=Volvox africanus TaxID=51714 RepID=A0A8J4BQ12_9CHLO|nr:hypothetical protein Vafri_19593 [Volvox africanus]
MMFVHPDGQSEDRACLEDKIRCLTRNVEEASAKASKAAVQAGMSYNVATGELSPLPDGTGGVESVEALQARLNALREEVAVQQQQEALLESQIQADLQAHQQNRGAALHQVQEAERQVKLSREAVAAATAARAQQAQAKAAAQHSKAQHQNGKPPGKR